MTAERKPAEPWDTEKAAQLAADALCYLTSALREHNACALDQLLLQRFGGRVGRGLAVELARRRDVSTQVDSLFTPVLTHLRNDGKASEVSSHS